MQNMVIKEKEILLCKNGTFIHSFIHTQSHQLNMKPECNHFPLVKQTVNIKGNTMASSDSDSNFERAILTPKRRESWKSIEVTEEEVSNKWRVKMRRQVKDGEVHHYYCCMGRYCAAKLRKTILNNGIISYLSNSSEHSNHRSDNFGLTEVQKDIVKECLKSGVTCPDNILTSFRSKDIEEPQ